MGTSVHCPATIFSLRKDGQGLKHVRENDDSFPPKCSGSFSVLRFVC